ncbi:glycosyltransferase [Candidatus Pelagibacter ubique]|nr:glycosyltransferase [Candidatus Pelagibacter ubique]
MKKKIKILRIISSLDKKYGGPPATIIDNSIVLNQNGFEVDIVTSDPINSNFSISKKLNIINLGPAIGNYKFNLKLFFWLIKNKEKYDKFIIHGIWQFNTLIARLVLKKKYFIFTHGQLDPFFYKEKLKVIKKFFYWKLFERKNLLQSDSLLLTSKDEQKNIKNTFVNTVGIKSTVISYGILKPNINIYESKKKFKQKYRIFKNTKFFLYIGRFHEKKGCDILIRSIKKIIDQEFNIKILMIGPNSSHKNKLKNLTNNLNLRKNIYWLGPLYDDLKWGAIASSEGMVLASNGENFGVSIAESLSLGTPVIITNKVNIYREILEYKCGLVANNSIEDFSKTIIKFLKLNKKKKNKMRVNSKLCFNDKFNLKFNQNKLISILKR